MKRLILLGTVGLVGLAFGVTVREEVMSVRPNVDGWAAEWCHSTFAYTNGVGKVLMKGPSLRLYPKARFPGPKRMRGGAYVLRTDPAFGGEVTMTVRRERKDHGSNIVRRVTAPWQKETRFDFGLLADEAYYPIDFTFKAKGSAWPQTVRILGVDALTEETPAQALRVEVETGNPAHLVRDGRNERAELVMRNRAKQAFEGRVALTVEDYFGNRRESAFPVRLAPGGEQRKMLKEELPKGIRYVTAVVSAGGTVATNKTTWAYLDLHEVTPKQPKGEFRLGINYHGVRHTPGNREIGLGAIVALGAKLVRTDVFLFCSVRPSADTWNWDGGDAYLRQLEERGIDLNAIIWWPAPWALAKDKDGKTLEFAMRHDALREYGERLGERYGTRIAYYEVGNEWDMSNPKRLPYEEAVSQVRELAQGIKAACPKATVMPCGFAADCSVRHPAHVIRPMFQENLIRDVQDVVDVHPVHGHSPAKEFMLKMRNFLAWRTRMGVKLPWYANESAVSTSAMRPTDRLAAITLWQKILFAWSRGSIDYIWYNLRATGWDPADSEQGFGMFTADFHPRSAAAAFSAMASTFRHLAADGILFDGPERQVLRFKDAQGGKTRVIAGWDTWAKEPQSVWVRTDATAAWQVDTMGNRSPVAIEKGVAVWKISANPSALRLEGASCAEPLAEDAANAVKRPVLDIRPGPQMKDLGQADILLKEYEQVYEIYKAIPEYADLTWKWWDDLWVWVNTAYADGKLKFRITCWDNVHHPVPQDPLQGDCAVLRLGEWRLALVGAKQPFVKVLAGPNGRKAIPDTAWKLIFRPGYHKVYELELDPRPLNLGNDIPFNIRVYDNDGKCPKGWMEAAPLDGPAPAAIRLF